MSGRRLGHFVGVWVIAAGAAFASGAMPQDSQIQFDRAAQDLADATIARSEQFLERHQAQMLDEMQYGPQRARLAVLAGDVIIAASILVGSILISRAIRTRGAQESHPTGGL